MAATMSAWAKPGAWALDSEEHESELVQLKRDDSFNSTGNGKVNDAGGDYPSLAAAAAAPKSKKKSKGQTLSLQEFYNGPKQPASQPKGPTPDELLALPTGPRQRSAEELERARGGFRSFRDEQQPRRQRDDFMPPPPSRADEIDDWSKTKKSPAATNGGGFERRERREYFRDSQSRADEVDNWGRDKAFVPSDRRSYERRGFDANGSGKADSDDNWGKRKEEEGKKFGSSFDSLRERRGGGVTPDSDSDNWSGRKREEITNGGGERRRLNLQPRTLPLETNINNESLVKPKGSNPFGDARPREEVLKEKGQDLKEIEEHPLESNNIESSVKSKGSNPFGNARPREEVLKEKGQDWKEIDEKLESAKNAKEHAGEERERRRRGYGSGSWKGILTEDRGDQTWRKPAQVVVDARTPPSRSMECA